MEAPTRMTDPELGFQRMRDELNHREQFTSDNADLLLVLIQNLGAFGMLRLRELHHGGES